jgi:heat shock protein HslJ
LLIATTLAACGSSAAPAHEMAGPQRDVVGRWHADLTDTDAYQELVLNHEHRIAGYDGCNRVVGKWGVDRSGQDAVSVDIHVQSFKACPKVVAADLGKAATAAVVDGRLRLLDGSGALVTSLSSR